jgi:hypothetical protein
MKVWYWKPLATHYPFLYHTVDPTHTGKSITSYYQCLVWYSGPPPWDSTPSCSRPWFLCFLLFLILYLKKSTTLSHWSLDNITGDYLFDRIPTRLVTHLPQSRCPTEIGRFEKSTPVLPIITTTNHAPQSPSNHNHNQLEAQHLFHYTTQFLLPFASYNTPPFLSK